MPGCHVVEPRDDQRWNGKPVAKPNLEEFPMVLPSGDSNIGREKFLYKS
jgi:hypothetical protein